MIHIDKNEEIILKNLIYKYIKIIIVVSTRKNIIRKTDRFYDSVFLFKWEIRNES